MTTDADQRVRIHHDDPSYGDRYARVFEWTWTIRLSPKARTLYIYLLSRAGANKNGKAWPIRATIAAATGIGERCLHDLLHELEFQGLIRIQTFPPRQGRAAEYYIQTKDAVFARQAELQTLAAHQERLQDLHADSARP